MRKEYLRPLILVACLVAVTCSAMAYSGGKPGTATGPGQAVTAGKGIISLTGSLVQDKIIKNGDGTLTLSLVMTADDLYDSGQAEARGVDMVLVLDRSGSMQGQKLEDARRAILDLIAKLSDQDRFALVSYSTDVQRHANLLAATVTNRMLLKSAVNGIYAQGGTNLGAGLQEGIDILRSSSKVGNLGRVILISDGLANHGITDPTALGRMASVAVQQEFAISTVGVGSDFNEYLMTAIADMGTGSYYYLENPNDFAQVLAKEFHKSRIAAATSVEVMVPLPDGITLVDAAGYPIEYRDNIAVFRPGNILSGQSRKFYLTMHVPSSNEKNFALSNIGIRYQYDGRTHIIRLPDPLLFACVDDRQAVFSSINKGEWEEKVLKEDYNRLKGEVARAISSNNESEARAKIEEYRAAQAPMNAVVGSSSVAENLGEDLDNLSDQVKDSFAGTPSEIAIKQKKNAKGLQYDGYEGRRSSN